MYIIITGTVQGYKDEPYIIITGTVQGYKDEPKTSSHHNLSSIHIHTYTL